MFFFLSSIPCFHSYIMVVAINQVIAIPVPIIDIILTFLAEPKRLIFRYFQFFLSRCSILTHSHMWTAGGYKSIHTFETRILKITFISIGGPVKLLFCRISFFLVCVRLEELGERYKIFFAFLLWIAICLGNLLYFEHTAFRLQLSNAYVGQNTSFPTTVCICCMIISKYFLVYHFSFLVMFILEIIKNIKYYYYY